MPTRQEHFHWLTHNHSSGEESGSGKCAQRLGGWPAAIAVVTHMAKPIATQKDLTFDDEPRP